MDLGVALRTYLLTTPVASLVADRIGPAIRPQSEVLPAVAYTIVSDVPGYHYEGEDDLSKARVQFECWAKSYTDARALAEKLRLALSGYRGPMGARTVQSVFVEGAGDITAGIDGVNSSRVRGVRFDAMVTYERTPAVFGA